MKSIDGVPGTQALEDLLYELYETELGGVEIYTAALDAVLNEDLAEEWQKYLEQTQNHVEIASALLAALGLDPDQETPARELVRNVGATLVKNIQAAIAAGPPATAELVAAESVTLAETKDHMNWHLLGMLSKRAKGISGKAIREACEQVEPEEDRHKYHNQGWARELRLAALGLPAVLPPPEEAKDVETAIGAARAEKARGPSARHQD